MYYQDDTSPFYRVTYLSNYSPYIAPPGHYSLLSETSYSPHKHEDPATIVARVEQGMRNTRLLRDGDEIASRWLYHLDHSYPVPTLVRDPALGVIQPWLAGQDIVSRGRFGAWMYEIGNMDHSVMQGVEAINWLLEGVPEETWTGAQPTPTPEPVRPVARRRDAVLAIVGSGRSRGLTADGADGTGDGKLRMELTEVVHAEEIGTTATAPVATGAARDAGDAGDASDGGEG